MFLCQTRRQTFEMLKVLESFFFFAWSWAFQISTTEVRAKLTNSESKTHFEHFFL